MRIVALVRSQNHVCCRYRLAAFQAHLHSAGYLLELRTWPRWFLSCKQLVREIGFADVLIVQRRMPSSWQRRLLRSICGALVYDFDDALFLRNSFAAKNQSSARLSRKFRETMQHVDEVIAGNRFLRERALAWKPPERVHLIPTCINPDLYQPATHEPKSQLQLVWIGSANTLPSLRALVPAFDRLGLRHANVQLRVVCDRFPQLKNLQVIRRYWSQNTEALELAEADIGLAWMPDDLWSRGKCGLKILQYMAAGLPVLANCVGVHEEMIAHGHNGLLLRGPDDLVETTETLMHDAKLRRQMGAAGRRLVEQSYSVSHGAKRWLTVLDRLNLADRKAAS